MEDRLYTVKDTARILKTNTDAVYKLMKEGELPYLVLGSRKIRRYTLEKFLEERERQTMEREFPKLAYDASSLRVDERRKITIMRKLPEKGKGKKILDIITINGNSLYNE